MLKHYVTFQSPGALFSEDNEREVKDRIPANIVKIPDSGFVQPQNRGLGGAR